jgi:hypothetical protein
VFGGCYFNGRFAPEIPDEDGICGEEEQKPQKSPQHNVPLRGAYPAFAWASNPSRTLRRASKRSEAAEGVVELVTSDAIRASGLCGMRFGHVRAWATTESLKSPPQSWQREQPSPILVPSCSGV